MHLGPQIRIALKNDRIPQAAALGPILARTMKIAPAGRDAGSHGFLSPIPHSFRHPVSQARIWWSELVWLTCYFAFEGEAPQAWRLFLRRHDDGDGRYCVAIPWPRRPHIDLYRLAAGYARLPKWLMKAAFPADWGA